MTFASQQATNSDDFSCCTEPCLEASAKDEIQNYYLGIYKKIQANPREETDQMVWHIDENGKICLYHKKLSQTESHDLVSLEELLDLDSAMVPGTIKQQYVFRRLLEELDQVTFDNRALTATEKSRLDRFMTKSV